MLTDVESAAVQILVDRALNARVAELNMRQTFKRADVTNFDRLIEELEREARNYFGPCAKNVSFHGDDIKIDWFKMGKLQEVALRIRATKTKLEGEADKLSVKLDSLEAKAPAAFDRGHQILDQHNADVDAMESELRQLSNLPLE